METEKGAPSVEELLLREKLARQQRRERATEPVPFDPASAPPEKPEQPALRIPSRLLPEDDPWTIRRKPETEPDYDADTETQLRALIGECHFYMREVVYRFAMRTTDGMDRLQYLDRAMMFAETGAKVADSVARLRGGSVSETRQRMIVERVDTRKGEGEGGES